MPATSPTSCVSTQRTTSAMLRRSSAAASKSGASSLAAVAYQNSPSAVVPSALAASHRSAATRHASRHCPQPVSGDQPSPGAPLDAVGSMHHTRPIRARVPLVWRSRSPFTLAATTGPRQPRMAGTARLVVLPLCVGPDHHDGLGRLGRDAQRAAPRRGVRRGGGAPPGGGRPSPPAGGGRVRVAQRAPRRVAPTSGQLRLAPRPGRRSRPAAHHRGPAAGRPRRCRPLASGRSWPRRCRRCAPPSR